MKLKVFLALFCLAFAALAEESAARLVLAKSARIPGLKLKPGNYRIQIVESLPDRFILAVKEEHGSHSIATFLAIPDPGLPHLAGGRPIFWNNRRGNAVVRGLWLDQQNTGVQFVFEKDEAAELAKEYREPVPAVDPGSEGIKPLAQMNDSDRQVVTLWLLSAKAITPDGKETGIEAAKFVPGKQVLSKAAFAETADYKYVTPRPKTPRTAVAMPSTAGNFVSYLALGAICLASGFCLLRKSA